MFKSLIKKSNILPDFKVITNEKILRYIIEENRKITPGTSRYAPMTIESMARVQIEFDAPHYIVDKLKNLAVDFLLLMETAKQIGNGSFDQHNRELYEKQMEYVKLKVTMQ